MAASAKEKALAVRVAVARLGLTRKRRIRTKVKPARYPRNIEQQYGKALLGVVGHVEKTARSEIQPILERIKAAKTDSDSDEVHQAFDRARQRLSFTLPDSHVGAMARGIGKQVRQHADQELADQLKQAFGVNVFRLLARAKPKKVTKKDDDNAPDLGVDPFEDDPELEEQLEEFVGRNVALIQSIPRRALDQLEPLLLADLKAGKRASDIARDISDRFDVSESRAALIARSEVASFFGEVTKLRQTQAGISKFEWVTSGDERVRETHAAVDGEVFAWDDPPPGTVDATMTPGSEPNCRCVGTPYLEDFEQDNEDD